MHHRVVKQGQLGPGCGTHGDSSSCVACHALLDLGPSAPFELPVQLYLHLAGLHSEVDRSLAEREAHPVAVEIDRRIAAAAIVVDSGLEGRRCSGSSHSSCRACCLDSIERLRGAVQRQSGLAIVPAQSNGKPDP